MVGKWHQTECGWKKCKVYTSRCFGGMKQITLACGRHLRGKRWWFFCKRQDWPVGSGRFGSNHNYENLPTNVKRDWASIQIANGRRHVLCIGVGKDRVYAARSGRAGYARLTQSGQSGRPGWPCQALLKTRRRFFSWRLSRLPSPQRGPCYHNQLKRIQAWDMKDSLVD